jgi:hypothetical protein
MNNIQHHKEAFELINNFVVNDDDSFDDQSDDSYEPEENVVPNNDIQSTANLHKKKRELLNTFLHLCGSDKQIKITNSYNKLQKQSKANFLSSTRHLMQHILEFLASTDSTDVRRDLFMVDNGKSNCI